MDGIAFFVTIGKPDVPLANAGGGVIFLMQHFRQGQALGSNQRRTARAGEDRAAARNAKAHLSGHQAVARGCADRAGRVGIGEAHTFTRELIDVRRGDFRFGMVARNITVAQVIGENEEDIGSFRFQGNCESEKSEKRFQ